MEGTEDPGESSADPQSRKGSWSDSGPVTEVCGVGWATSPFLCGAGKLCLLPTGLPERERGEMAVEGEGHSQRHQRRRG